MAVKELVDLTSANPSVIPKSVLEAIGDRIKDRKVRIVLDVSSPLQAWVILKRAVGRIGSCRGRGHCIRS